MSVQLSVKIIVIYKDIDFFFHHQFIIVEFSTLTPIRFFRLAASAWPRSSVSWLLVPCSRNWPVYFSSFAVFWWGLYETYRYTREPDRTTPGWWPGGWSSSTGTAACTGLTWRLLKLFRWESNSFHCHKYNLRPFSCYPPLFIAQRNSRYPLPLFLISDTVNKFISRHLHVSNIYIFTRNSRRYIKSSFHRNGGRRYSLTYSISAYICLFTDFRVVDSHSLRWKDYNCWLYSLLNYGFKILLHTYYRNYTMLTNISQWTRQISVTFMSVLWLL